MTTAPTTEALAQAMSGKTPTTHIAIVLDASGSMSSIKQQAIELFNDQVNTVKKNPDPKTTITFTTFGYHSLANVEKFGVELDKLDKLTNENYTPDGMTPMYDGIGMTIDKIERELVDENDDYAVLVIIVTDGMENASKDYTGQQVAERIKRLQGGGRWTFTFLGANIDVEKMGQALNLHAKNIMSYESYPIGTRVGAAATSRGTEKFMALRKSGATECMDFYDNDSDDGKSDET